MTRCRHCTLLRRLLALEMRENGKTFEEIGAALGITKASAHKVYQTAIKDRAKARAAAAAREAYVMKGLRQPTRAHS